MALRPINGGVLRRSLTTAGLPTAADFPSWAYDAKDYFRFEVLHESTKSLARVGRITTPHGNIDTPGFVAVGTNAALKAVDFPAADAAGQQLVFANTYHLILHPTPNVIRDAGGIHKFTGRNGPFITGSGGFQVFSLKYGSVKESLESKGLKMASSRSKSKPYWRTDVMGDKAVKVTEDHVIFKSYRDGSMVILSPESSIQAQKAIHNAVQCGVDTMDSSYPTKLARHGTLLTKDGSHTSIVIASAQLAVITISRTCTTSSKPTNPRPFGTRRYTICTS